jgi:hypothetical protein
MKKTFYFLIVAIGIMSCKKSTENYLDNAFLQPKDNIYVVLDSFVQENNISDYVYELYIDKKTPEYYLLTVYCGAKSLTEKENYHKKQVSLNYTIVSGKQFNIFSGAEHYFKRGNDTVAIMSKSEIENIMWIIRDSSNIISVYKELQFTYYPFVPLPTDFPNEVFNPPF